MAIKFGVMVPQGWKMDLIGIPNPVEQYEAMTRVAQVAEELGFDSIWVYDHFHTVPVPTQETTFESWTITAGLVRDTKRVRVGQMVTCNGFRHPALLAKMASTVDVMSRGRLICGLGAGWYEHEWRAYGYGFPELPERMGMFREACEIVCRMWTEDEPVFKGKYYAIDKPINQPHGARKPHPEFWLGGGGEKVTLKLVAKWANGCNVGAGNPDTVRQKLDVLRRHCEDVGRDINELTRSTNIQNIHLLRDGEDPARMPAWAEGKLSPELYRQNIRRSRSSSSPRESRRAWWPARTMSTSISPVWPTIRSRYGASRATLCHALHKLAPLQRAGRPRRARLVVLSGAQ